MERMELSAGVGDQRSYGNSDHRIWGLDGYGLPMQYFYRSPWDLCFCPFIYGRLGERKRYRQHIVRSSIYENLAAELY